MDKMVIGGDWSRFLDLPGEKILLVRRKHPLVVIFPLILLFLLTIASAFLSYFIFSTSFLSGSLLAASLLLIISMCISGGIFIYIYWYYHLYILTNRKILETRYTPLFSHDVNDIFLDNVNCTEVDLSSNGFFNELMDMGDITITFDRPTHEEEFTLQDVKSCDLIGKFLVKNLLNDKRPLPAEDIIWMKGKVNAYREAKI